MKNISINNYQINRAYDERYGYYCGLKQNNKLVYPYRNLFVYSDNFKNVNCPKCDFKLNLLPSISNYLEYVCMRCEYKVKFADYQKRYINLNWLRYLKRGIDIYSWDYECVECHNKSPVFSYCINESFGTEALCCYEPILYGSLFKLDEYLSVYSKNIHLNYQENGDPQYLYNCPYCHNEVHYQNLVNSFMKQRSFIYETTIQQNIFKSLPITADDINHTLKNLIPMKK